MSQPKSFTRPAIAAMAPYVPGEQPQGGGFVKLNTNENPYPPSPHVVAALRAAANDDIRLYPDPMATELRRKAAQVYGLDPENVVVGNGSDELLSMIVRAFVGEGERVAYPTPTYSLYDTLIEIQEGEIVHVPYSADFSLPPELSSCGAKLIFVCHPNAPTGVAVRLAELTRLAEAAKGVLVIDEAYVDFAEESALELVRRYPHVIVLRTFSKSFSLAGLRIGLGFGAPGLIADVTKVKDSYNLSRLSIRAGTAALEDYEWMRTNVAKVKQTRGRLIGELRRRGFSVPDSQTNFVLARRPGIDQRQTYLDLKQRQILVRYFAVPGLEDAMRITVGTDAEIDQLLTALDQISREVPSP